MALKYTRNSTRTQLSTGPKHTHKYPAHDKYANITLYPCPNTRAMPHDLHMHDPTLPTLTHNSLLRLAEHSPTATHTRAPTSSPTNTT